MIQLGSVDAYAWEIVTSARTGLHRVEVRGVDDQAVVFSGPWRASVRTARTAAVRKFGALLAHWASMMLFAALQADPPPRRRRRR